MKRTLILLTTVAAILATAPVAEAGRARRAPAEIYVTGRTSCGCPVRAERRVVARDACGHLVFAERRLPVRHHCHPRRPAAGACPPAPWHSTPGYHRGPVLVPARPVPPRCR